MSSLRSLSGQLLWLCVDASLETTARSPWTPPSCIYAAMMHVKESVEPSRCLPNGRRSCLPEAPARYVSDHPIVIMKASGTTSHAQARRMLRSFNNSFDESKYLSINSDPLRATSFHENGAASPDYNIMRNVRLFEQAHGRWPFNGEAMQLLSLQLGNSYPEQFPACMQVFKNSWSGRASYKLHHCDPHIASTFSELTYNHQLVNVQSVTRRRHHRTATWPPN